MLRRGGAQQRMGADGWVVPAQAFLLVGVWLVAVVLTVPRGTPQALGHAAVNLSATLALVAGVRWHRPPSPQAWQLLALGAGLFGMSNLAWAAGAAGVPYAWVDTFDFGTKMLAFIALSGAVAHLLRSGRLPGTTAGVLDSVLVLVGAVMLLGQIALLAEASHRNPLVLSLFVTGSLAVLSVAAGLVAMRFLLCGRGTVVSALLMLGGMLGLVGQALVLWWLPAEAPRWVDGTWLLAVVLAGTAGLHPMMVTERPPDLGQAEAWTLTPARLRLLSAALVVNPIVLVLTLVQGRHHALVLPFLLAAIGALTVLGIGGLAQRVVPGTPGGRSGTA